MYEQVGVPHKPETLLDCEQQLPLCGLGRDFLLLQELSNIITCVFMINKAQKRK